MSLAIPFRAKGKIRRVHLRSHHMGIRMLADNMLVGSRVEDMSAAGDKLAVGDYTVNSGMWGTG